MMRTRHPRRTRLSTAIVATTLIATSAMLLALPAHATSALDASGVDFTFVNATDVLADAANGDSFDYANVAQIDGVQIDARLTVVETFNSLGRTDIVFASQNAVTLINELKAELDPEADPLVDTGCYRATTVDGGPAMTLTADNTPADYLVGAADFDAATAFSVGSDFLVGSRLGIADEADDDPVDDAKIRTELYPCGGADFSVDPIVEYGHPSYVRLRVDFTTGDARTPVELANLTLSAFDIDNEQYLRLFSPLPDSYRVYDSSLLEICGPAALVGAAGECSGAAYAGSPDFLVETADATLEFYGEDGSDDGEVEEWAAEATYIEPVSSVTYQFGLRASGGRSTLEVGFESIVTEQGETPAPPVLAETGPTSTDVTATAGIAVASLLLGFAIIARGRRRATS